MARWSITDEALTGARWGLDITPDPDGRGAVVARDPVWTDLSNAQTGSIAVEFRSAADDGGTVSTGATWDDLARPVRFDWASYGLAVNLRLYGRTSGVWGRPAGLPSGQPAGVSGGVTAANFEIGENGLLRPTAAPQTDWLVEDRPDSLPADPPLRYTTVQSVKNVLKAPEGRASGSWQSGEFDDAIARVIRVAEQQIDSHCGRSFPPAAARSSARTYRERGLDHVDTDDFVGIPSSVAVGGRTVDAASWHTSPALDAHRTVNRGIWFPHGMQSAVPWYLSADYDRYDEHGDEFGWRDWSELPSVTVSARWGWDRVPDAVSYACDLISVRLFRRPDDAALGVATVAGEAVTLPGFDPDVEASLAPYRVV